MNEISNMTTSTPETTELGPRQIVTLTCNGCPAYKTDRWTEVGENDYVDSGTSSECTAVNRGITCYAKSSAPVPDWCPYVVKIPA